VGAVADYLVDLREWSPLFAQGLATTLTVTPITMVLASALGLCIAILRILPYRGALRCIPFMLRAYVEVFRGLPIIVVLFIVYFGLPAAGIRLTNDPLVAGILGLTLTLSAYLSEVFRAAVLSVDPGQMEACRSIGMSAPQAFRRIIVPQALLVAVPTLGGYFIGLLKETSLLGFISVFDLMRAGVVITSNTFKPFEAYLTVGAIYLILSLASAWGAARIEARLRPADRVGTAETGHQPAHRHDATFH
jgi:His/Glu/Gln/Arg/opine family amino acid ABC transporter permease subunit